MSKFIRNVTIKLKNQPKTVPVQSRTPEHNVPNLAHCRQIYIKAVTFIIDNNRFPPGNGLHSIVTEVSNTKTLKCMCVLKEEKMMHVIILLCVIN